QKRLLTTIQYQPESESPPRLSDGYIYVPMVFDSIGVRLRGLCRYEIATNTWQQIGENYWRDVKLSIVPHGIFIYGYLDSGSYNSSVAFFDANTRTFRRFSAPNGDTVKAVILSAV